MLGCTSAHGGREDGRLVDPKLHDSEFAVRKDELPREIRKFTLPLTEARELLRLVAAHDIDAASLFPGYAGAAESIMERDL